MRRSIATFLAAIIFLAAVPQAAFSQSDSGEIAITVVDATTKAPIALARVLLDGAVIISEQTSSAGEVRFTERHLSRADREARLYEPHVGVL
jgi:hypothetical protein